LVPAVAGLEESVRATVTVGRAKLTLTEDGDAERATAGVTRLGRPSPPA
jgi:hypothetical protein